jgi:hypothetical protein
MFLIDPKAVVAANHAVDIEDGGMHKSADAKNTAELAFGEAVFKAMHGRNAEVGMMNAEFL